MCLQHCAHVLGPKVARVRHGRVALAVGNAGVGAEVQEQLSQRRSTSSLVLGAAGMERATRGSVADPLAPVEPCVGVGLLREQSGHFRQVALAQRSPQRPLGWPEARLRCPIAAEELGRRRVAACQRQEQRRGRASALGVGGLVEGSGLPVPRRRNVRLATPGPSGWPGAVGDELGNGSAVTAGRREHQRLVNPPLLVVGELGAQAGELNLPASRQVQRPAHGLRRRGLDNLSTEYQPLRPDRHPPLLLDKVMDRLQRAVHGDGLQRDALTCQVPERDLGGPPGARWRRAVQTDVLLPDHHLPPPATSHWAESDAHCAEEAPALVRHTLAA
eukprot:CAMPEP_0171211778 /NCGR_PEP_ID=MMETSP0790-20130122/29797_1 /TAXON_ID=2925 /ORGANISM="Alexandrium catenella, Strain OF101" /LENGTH=330 /DNA_ID=CAMNT_0011677451 /DNA_START=138 /DNA_END=1130 /DNA_ORIENTATION=+